MGLNATYMLMELLKDNIFLVDSVSEEQFDKFVGLMIKNKVNCCLKEYLFNLTMLLWYWNAFKKFQNYRYLKLFEVLCIVNNVALAEKQNFIVKKWLQEPIEKNEVHNI